MTTAGKRGPAWLTVVTRTLLPSHGARANAADGLDDLRRVRRQRAEAAEAVDAGRTVPPVASQPAG